MNILLHICCAPCAIYPIEKMKKDLHAVAGFFYNPNIHPYSEYLRRKDALEKYSIETGLTVTYSDYEIENYFQHIVYNEASNNRCPVCWWLRLEKTAKFARENGFEAFTTTLLGSPYQDCNMIKNVCEEIAKRLDLKFYDGDFKFGFREAHNKAKANGIYCQNYCGCVFSEKEMIEKRSNRREC